MKGKLIESISQTFEELKRKNTIFVVIGIVLVFLISYTFIVISSSPSKKIVVENNRDKGKYEHSRVLGDFSSSGYRGKNRIFSKKLNSMAKGQKSITDSLSRLAKRLEEIELQSQKEEAEKEKKALEKEKTESKVGNVTFHTSSEEFTASKGEMIKHTKKKLKKIKRKSKRLVVSFPVKDKTKRKKLGIVLPSGSYVKAKLLTGVEVPEGKTYPVLAQLDYAFIAPSNTRIDLSGCFLILKSTGDLSTESVQFQATKLSCVSKKGMMFERKVNGFIADNKDSNFAVKGEVLSKQGRVARMALVSSIVEKASTLISGAKSGTTKALGSSGGDAASIVANWYLKQAQSLLPTIRVGSGQDIWVVMADRVDLPTEYFKRTKRRKGNETIYSYFSNILD